MGSRKTSTGRSAPATDPRLPEPHGDLQVNVCRNPACPNFGVEALSALDRGRPRKDRTTKQDGYSTIPGEREIHEAGNAGILTAAEVMVFETRGPLVSVSGPR